MPANKQKEFIDIYNQVHRNLSDYCRVIVGNNEDAKDLFNDCIMAAYENFEKIRNKESFKYYVFKIASNTFKKKLRRKKFTGKYNPGDENILKDNKMNAEQITDLSLLYKKLSMLPIKQKEAIVLFEINGFSIKEISNIQNDSISAVKSRLSRGRDKLKQLLHIKD